MEIKTFFDDRNKLWTGEDMPLLYNPEIWQTIFKAFNVFGPKVAQVRKFVLKLKLKEYNSLHIRCFIVVVVSTLLLSISGYWQMKKILLLQYVGSVINLLVNDNASIRNGQLHPAAVYVILLTLVKYGKYFH